VVTGGPLTNPQPIGRAGVVRVEVSTLGTSDYPWSRSEVPDSNSSYPAVYLNGLRGVAKNPDVDPVGPTLVNWLLRLAVRITTTLQGGRLDLHTTSLFFWD